MEQVTVSPKYQIVIPSAIRKELNIKPGEKIYIFNDNGTLKLVPKMEISDLFGIAKGIDSSFDRDEEDRF